MILGSYPRRNSERLAPFSRDGRFHHLTLKNAKSRCFQTQSGSSTITIATLKH